MDRMGTMDRRGKGDGQWPFARLDFVYATRKGSFNLIRKCSQVEFAADLLIGSSDGRLSIAIYAGGYNRVDDGNRRGRRDVRF